MSSRLVLVINCGSSSIKFAVREEDTSHPLLSGLAERLGTPQATLQWRSGDHKHEEPLGEADHTQAMARLLPLIGEHTTQPLAAVGHRVVHGGEHFTGARLIDDQVIAAIDASAPLAPLHNPANLTGIRAAMELLPDVQQVAIFDTAFHQSMPAHATATHCPMICMRYTASGVTGSTAPATST